MQSIRNEMESNPAFLDQGFLVIGSALNGDWIAMDLLQHPGAIGYLGKDQVVRDAIGPRDNLKLVLVEDLRQKFFEISPSLGAFALGVVKDALPIDSYATWSDENENASWFAELRDDEDAGHRAS